MSVGLFAFCFLLGLGGALLIIAALIVWFALNNMKQTGKTQTFFTSDTHFNHANVVQYDNRPFADEDEMTHELIQRWNGVVHPGDIVYHLGDFSLSGWDFKKFYAETTIQPLQVAQNQAFNLTGIQFVIELKRKPAFYIWKVFFPLGLIAFMAWTVFWIDPANFGGQVAISTSSVITLIAFQLSLSELLPRISYLTNIDIYAIGTSLLVFLALGESILTARLAKMEKHHLSLGIDRHMRWVYPTIYALLTLFVII